MATTAREMVTKIKDALAKSPAAKVSISVDGQSVTYDRGQAIQELQFWERMAARESGSRPRVGRIKLTGF